MCIRDSKYAKPEATDDEVFEAADLAMCKEFIDNLDEGYQTMIGENGVKLSGGEKQRISIARAFLKKSKIILLDEATASLDSETEELVPGGWQEITIEVKPPLMQAATEASGTLNVTLSTDTSKSVKKALPFSVLKSDFVVDEPVVDEEDSLLPGPSLISVIILVTLLSRIRRR